MIVHAPYIHTGGGKTLLSEFVNFNNKSLEIYLDKKYPYENIDKNNYKKIKNNFFHTLFPNKYYSNYLHLFFHGLPPIFKRSSNKNICFFQNLFLIEKSHFSKFDFSKSLRLFFKKKYFSLFVNNFDIFIVQNESTRKSLSNFLKKKNINKKIEIMTLFNFKNDSQIVEKKYDFIYPAEFLPHKNHYLLIDALLDLSYQGIYPKLILTFNINLLSKHWRDKINNNNLKIEFANDADRDKFLLLFSQSKCLIYPSIKESLGLPLLEAQSMSIPIVASELDFVRDVVNPVETFNPYSSLSIQRAIKRFMNIKEKTLIPINIDKFIERVSLF